MRKKTFQTPSICPFSSGEISIMFHAMDEEFGRVEKKSEPVNFLCWHEALWSLVKFQRSLFESLLKIHERTCIQRH